MPHLELQSVSKRFGDFAAISNLDLSVKKGEFCALLGPSGCGKSTLLRTIAGLEEASAGKIFINGLDVTRVRPAKRRIAMVFQSYALYPHLSVRDNIAFSLSVAGEPRDVQRRRADAVASVLKLEALMDRKPAQLSGGQRQRVAIGRALVRDPEVFLFDEPLSNLDAMLRVQMRIELAKLHKSLGATMVYVTHDQVEAMTLADRVVVLNNGVVMQIGAPLELYAKPKNKFVASFIGSPAMNFLDVETQAVDDAAAKIVVRGVGASWSLPLNIPLGISKEPTELGIRPEHIALTEPSHANAIGGKVVLVERLGNTTVIYVETAAGQLVVETKGELKISVDDAVGLVLDTARAHVFSSDGGALAL